MFARGDVEDTDDGCLLPGYLKDTGDLGMFRGDLKDAGDLSMFASLSEGHTLSQYVCPMVIQKDMCLQVEGLSMFALC